MAKMDIKLVDVIDNTPLPELSMDQAPANGDPIEINGEMYYVCDRIAEQENGWQTFGVIPLVVKNPSGVSNIKTYIECLTVAHRRVLYKKKGEKCSFDECDEMVIS